MNRNPLKRNKKLKFMTEEGKKSRNRKIIFSVFAIFIVILSTASVLYFLKTYDYDFKKALGIKQEESEEDKKPKTKLQGKATFLVAVTSNKKDELHFVAIIKPNMDKVQISVTCLDTDARTSVNGNSQTLQYSYINGGANELVSATENYTNIKIDRYAVTTEKKFKYFIARLGNYKLTLNESVSYNEGNFAVNLIKGKQTLTGDRLLNYIIYQKKKGGAYLNEQALILCDVLDQLISSKNFYEDDDKYDELINLVDSDISIVDYTKNKGLLLAYIESEDRQKSVNVDLSTLKK